jgi:hypothetical protein
VTCGLPFVVDGRCEGKALPCSQSRVRLTGVTDSGLKGSAFVFGRRGFRALTPGGDGRSSFSPSRGFTPTPATRPALPGCADLVRFDKGPGAARAGRTLQTPFKWYGRETLETGASRGFRPPRTKTVNITRRAGARAATIGAACPPQPGSASNSGAPRALAEEARASAGAVRMAGRRPPGDRPAARA